MFNKTLNYISYLRYVAYLWGAYLSLPEIFLRSENFISNVGLGLFLFGVALSFESLKDSKGYSEREKKLYTDTKKSQRIIMIYTFLFLYAILVGILFFNLSFIYPQVDPTLLADFKDLGYGSVGLGIGGFGIIKEQLNRFKSFQQSPE